MIDGRSTSTSGDERAGASVVVTSSTDGVIKVCRSHMRMCVRVCACISVYMCVCVCLVCAGV